MKSAANGGIQLSVLDGWWVEGYARDNGFAIGAGEEYSDLNYQDDVESRAIYDLLEQELVPAFFNRGSDGVPRHWVRIMKNSMRSLCPVFNTNRMVEDYMRMGYWPSHERFLLMTANNSQPAKSLASWKKQIEKHWGEIRVEVVEAKGADGAVVGQELPVVAKVRLGALSPKDVEVQLFHGPVDSLGEIARPHAVSMSPNGSPESGLFVYHGAIPCTSSGQHGFAVRVLPKHEGLSNPFTTGLVAWG
jgi:starch phosphorylase